MLFGWLFGVYFMKIPKELEKLINEISEAI